jgi:predicted DNA-binding transcriptional regulator
MANDQIVGAGLLIGALVGMVLYVWLLFFGNALLVLQLTIFVVVAGVLVIVAWIGYTMATTPRPEPIEFDDVS